MAVRTLCVLLLAAVAQCQQSDFCSNGIEEPNFYDDHNKPSIEVVLAAAPLVSNKLVGGTFGLLNLYKTVLAFKQKRPLTGIDHLWTLEFDFTKGSLLTGTVPKIVNEELVWDDDARYCLTDGLVGGKEQWTKEFDTVMTITKEQAMRLFSEFIRPMNSSAKGAFPQFQLWRMVKTPGIKLPKMLEGDNRKQHVLNLNTMLSDVTASDGINWVLHFIKEKLGVAPHEGFQYRGTTVWINANKLEKVDRADNETWTDLMKYYKLQARIAKNSSSITDKFVMASTNLFPMRYVHNANTDTYFRVLGNAPPFFHVEYAPQLLAAPPAAAELKEKLDGGELEQRNAVQLKALENEPDATVVKVLNASRGKAIDLFGMARKAAGEALTTVGEKTGDILEKLDQKMAEEREKAKKAREEAKAKQPELAEARMKALQDKKAALEAKKQKILEDFKAMKENPEEFKEKEQKAARDAVQSKKQKQIAAHKAKLAAAAEQAAKEDKLAEDREVAAAFKSAKKKAAAKKQTQDEEEPDEEEEYVSEAAKEVYAEDAKELSTLAALTRKTPKATDATEAQSEEVPEPAKAEEEPESTYSLRQRIREKKAQEKKAQIKKQRKEPTAPRETKPTKNAHW